MGAGLGADTGEGLGADTVAGFEDGEGFEPGDDFVGILCLGGTDGFSALGGAIGAGLRCGCDDSSCLNDFSFSYVTDFI